MYFYYIGHCLGNLRGAVELKQKGYYDMEKMRWLNTISNTQTFSAILTELENAERRKVNLKLDADKMA